MTTLMRPPFLGARETFVNIIAPHVLVVDDDEPIRDAIRMLLDDEGYHVIEAQNGQEALAVIQSSPTPLVVLLDLMMPKMTGTDVLQAVAADPALSSRHAFFLITAANRGAKQSVTGLPPHLHVTVLAKPIDITELLDHIAQAADRLKRQSA